MSLLTILLKASLIIVFVVCINTNCKSGSGVLNMNLCSYDYFLFLQITFFIKFLLNTITRYTLHLFELFKYHFFKTKVFI